MTLIDNRIAWWSVATTLAFLLAWTVGADSNVRYVLYGLPVALILLHVAHRQLQIELEPRALYAFLIYAAMVGASVLHSGSLGDLALRDMLIIGSYLLLFAFRYRAPPATIDVALAGLFICMLAEHRSEGIHLTVNLLGSTGIMESSFAFPIGLILLYYVQARRWRAAAITAILLFMAFKRIALLGAVAAITFDRGLALVGMAAAGRVLAPAIVLLCSLGSLFSVQIFAMLATLTGGENVSANSISLGRFEFAEALWRALGKASPGTHLFGFGPGAAETYVHAALGLSNPHNDWLKLFFDYGFFGFVGFSIILFIVFPKNAFGRMLYIYTGVLFISDNTLIYTFHQVILVLVVQAAAALPSLQVRPAWYGRPMQAFVT
jgi:hypothetical protein